MKNKNNISAQELLGIEDINNDMLISKGFVLGFIAVRGNDTVLLSDTEKEVELNKITTALEQEQKPWQLISIPRVVDTHDLIEHLLKFRNNSDNEQKINLLNNEILSLQSMAKNGLKEPLLYLKIWEPKGKKSEESLIKRRSDLIGLLKTNGVSATAMPTQDIIYICKLFAELGQHHSLNDDMDQYSAIPRIKGFSKLKKEKPEETLRREKIDLITPTGAIKFTNRNIVIGDMTSRCLYASLFPSQLNYEWAVRIMNCTEAVTAITFSNANSGELANALSKSIKQNEREAFEQTDARTQKQLARQANDADTLIDRLDSDNEAIGQLSIITMPFTDNEEHLEEVCRRVSTLFSVNRIKTRILGLLQKEAFLTISPYGTPQKVIEETTKRIMPLSTLMGGTPMTVNTLKDDSGFYFGKTMDGGIISLDFKKRGGDRTNSNIVITGKPGTGKSTAVKHIMQNLYMSGWKIIVIDPEREYKDMCITLGGAWFDAGSGTYKNNVFQIRSVPVDVDEQEEHLLFLETNEDKPLVQHMKTLETFLYTYLPSLTDLQKSLLNQAIIEMYKNFGIEWDTNINNFKPTDFPIFSDLYSLLLKKAKSNSKYDDIASLFYNIAEGTDSFLWNGYSNIDVDNDFVVFDTNKLSGANDRILSTQYFNLLTQAWSLMSEDKEKPVALICDEAYLLINPDVPQILMYLRNISKRIRKYGGALGVISHSLIDFLDEKIRMYGQALLENPTYKLFFGTDGQNLKETTNLYNLSEQEQNILQAGVRGEALALIGNQRIKVRFDIPKYKLELMGKGGGA